VFPSHRKQTRAASLAESLANVLIGYGLSVATTAVVLPWLFAIYIPIGANLAIGVVFTVVSIARSFAIRRFFEALRVRGR
jgi:hypothetical protein